MVNNQLMAQIEAYNRGILPPQNKAVIEELAKRQDPDLLDTLSAYGEAGASMLNQAIAEPISGLAGLVSAGIGGAEQGAQTVENTRDALTFTPSQPAQQALQQIGDTLMNTPILGDYLQVASEAPTDIGDMVYERTGSPLLGALSAGGTGAALEVGIPVKGGKMLTQPMNKERLATASMFVAPERKLGSQAAADAVEQAKRYKEGFTTKDKSRYTRLQNKMLEGADLTDTELADYERLEDILDVEYSANKDAAIWERTGVFELPNGKWSAEISDDQAKFKPIAMAYFNEDIDQDAIRSGMRAYGPELEYLTYRPRSEGNETVYDVQLGLANRQAGAGAAPGYVEDTITDAQLERFFPGEVADKIRMQSGVPDVLDMDADELVEDAFTLRNDSMYGQPLTMNTDGLHIGDVLEHKELQNTYPEFMDGNIDVNLISESMRRGGSMSYDGDMKVNRRRGADDALSTMLHEAQHAVQMVEGWPAGGNASKRAIEMQSARANDQLQQEYNSKFNEILDADDKDLNLFANMYQRALGTPLRNGKSEFMFNPRDVSRATYEIDYMRKLGQLAQSDRPQKFANYSDFYRDANDYRKQFGVEPKRRNNKEANNEWWRGLIEFSAQRTAGERSEPVDKLMYTMMEMEDEGVSLNKVRNAYKRSVEKMKPLKEVQRKKDLLRQRMKNIESNRFNDDDSFQFYRDLYGEQQSRDTQARQNMTPAIRETILPMQELRDKENKFTTDFPYSSNSVVVTEPPVTFYR